VSIIIGHGITLQALDGLSREIRLDLRGGINTYGYVGGNPVSYIDPLGLWRLPDFLAVNINIAIPNPITDTYFG
jgi:hypothetical protein